MTDQPARSARPLRPPRFVCVPVALAYAEANDPALLTLIRILGLGWDHGGRRTPALSGDQLVRALGRSPRTLKRHLAYLEEQGWLRIDRLGEGLVLRPRLEGLPALDVAEDDPEADDVGSGPDHRLQEVLAKAGIENPVRDQLACDPALQPHWVEAWRLWTRHPERASLANPPGFIVQQLRAGYVPPLPYQHLVGLSPEELAELRFCSWGGDIDSLPQFLFDLLPLYLELQDVLESDPA